MAEYSYSKLRNFFELVVCLILWSRTSSVNRNTQLSTLRFYWHLCNVFHLLNQLLTLYNWVRRRVAWTVSSPSLSSESSASTAPQEASTCEFRWCEHCTSTGGSRRGREVDTSTDISLLLHREEPAGSHFCLVHMNTGKSEKILYSSRT